MYFKIKFKRFYEFAAPRQIIEAQTRVLFFLDEYSFNSQTLPLVPNLDRKTVLAEYTIIVNTIFRIQILLEILVAAAREAGLSSGACHQLPLALELSKLEQLSPIASLKMVRNHLLIAPYAHPSRGAGSCTAPPFFHGFERAAFSAEK